MPAEPEAIVRTIFEAWGRGDFKYGREHFEEHVMYVVRPDFPEFGVFVGLAEVDGFMHRFREHWSSVTYEIEDLREAGDTIVLRVRQHSKGIASGVEGDTPMFMLLSFRGRK